MVWFIGGLLGVCWVLAFCFVLLGFVCVWFVFGLDLLDNTCFVVALGFVAYDVCFVVLFSWYFDILFLLG